MPYTQTCPHCGYRTCICEYNMRTHSTTCYCTYCGYVVSFTDEEEEEEEPEDENVHDHLSCVQTEHTHLC